MFRSVRGYLSTRGAVFHTGWGMHTSARRGAKSMPPRTEPSGGQTSVIRFGIGDIYQVGGHPPGERGDVVRLHRRTRKPAEEVRADGVPNVGAAQPVQQNARERPEGLNMAQKLIFTAHGGKDVAEVTQKVAALRAAALQRSMLQYARAEGRDKCGGGARGEDPRRITGGRKTKGPLQ